MQAAYEEFEVDQHTYRSKADFFEFLEVKHKHGECCNRCLESYRIKAVDLPRINRAHGIAKNNITRIGKSLMEDKTWL